MSKRNEYRCAILFNGARLNRIIIDQHYKEKHNEITDELILNILLQKVNDISVRTENNSDETGFQYFKVRALEFQNRYYRLILVTSKTEDYLGVVNAFRVEKRK